MNPNKSLRLLLVSTPIGCLGSGKGGGVELTIASLIKGLIARGHEIILIVPTGSKVPFSSNNLEIKFVSGIDQASWQHQDENAPVIIPLDGVLPRLWEKAIELGSNLDAVLNFGYDWLPIWLTPFVKASLFHLVSMGGESLAMKNVIKDISKNYHNRLAFHTKTQARDYVLSSKPNIVGNGFDLKNYNFSPSEDGPLGWAGRIAPEKGLEDAVAVASSLGVELVVWGLMEDPDYAAKVESTVPKGIIKWRGFLSTHQFQKELRSCRGLLNTPKWNEAYGNVVVEAMACGVPVVAYARGGPGELIVSGLNGVLVPPDDIPAMIEATKILKTINRYSCRRWVEDNASHNVFAERVEKWIENGLTNQKSNDISED